MAKIRIRNLVAGVAVVGAAVTLASCTRGGDPAGGIGLPTSTTAGSTSSSASTTTTTATTTTTTTPPPPVKPPVQPPKNPTPAPLPPLNGFPNADNTGVPADVKPAVVDGDQTFSRDGEVVEGKDFHGFVKVIGRNVTFRDSVFRGRATNSNAALLDTEDGTGTVVETSEFVPSDPGPTIDGLWTKSTSIFRSDIHGAVDGLKANSNTLIQDSYIHDMSWFASDPNQGGGSTHNDGVQSFPGESNVVLRHNTVDMSTTNDANAALQSSALNTTVENNLLDGGGCTLNFDHKSTGAALTGISIIGNRFGRNSFFKCPILLSTQAMLSQNSGNVWNDTGEPIPSPQRHD